MSREKELEYKLEESYNHIKDHMKGEKTLYETCKNCEAYCGKEHDYEECRHKQCFKNWLAYIYLRWCIAWEE